MRVPSWFVSIAISVGAIGTSLRAQCANAWLPGEAVPGVLGEVFATATWDPDGAGPLPAQLVVGGSFTVAGDVFCANIASFDHATGTWSSLGVGTNGAVRALAILPTGELVAAGSFTQAGGVAAARIARWNGNAWSPLGSGFDAEVVALCLGPNGILVATGSFLAAGGIPASRIAQWDGANWSACGSGLSAPGAALVQLATGEAVVGGGFWTAGGLVANGVASWNGSSWALLGNGVGPIVRAIAVAPNGDLVAAGFNGIIQRWNGATWTPMPQANITTNALTFLPNGDLLAHGWLPYGQGLLSLFNGTWTSITTMGLVNTLRTEANGSVVLGGTFRIGGGVSLATWNGTFAPIGTGFDNWVGGVCALPDGGMVVVGNFQRAGATLAKGIARWNGANWSALGSGANGSLSAVTALPNGDIVAGGSFTQIDGVAANYVARWNGTAWSALGAGVGGFVSALATLPNGQLLAAARAYNQFPTTIVRWNGSVWQPLGAATNHLVTDLLVLPNGDIIASGEFTAIGAAPVNRIARWDGTTWTSIAYPGSRAYGLSLLPNGDLLASDYAGVWRWNGLAWSTVGSAFNGTVANVLGLPNGDVLAIGYFLQAGGQPANRIARWNGATWTAVGAGFDSYALDIARLTNDDVVVTGPFMTAGDQVSTSVARLTTTCPASAVPFGAGCTGSGGLNSHTATALPWLGATFRAEASGMPANGFVVAVTGFNQVAVPLPWVLVEALPGCQGLVTPDAVELLLPVAGRVQTQLAIPANAGLVGLALHQYVVAFELGAVGQIAAITSSNALTLQIGSF